MFQPPIFPIAIIIAIAVAHGELHPGTIEAGRLRQRLATFLAVVVVVVQGRRRLD